MKYFKILLVVILFSASSNLISQTVYTTKTGEKYHTENCKYLKYSKKELTLKKAKEFGYTACSVCKPSTNNTEKTSEIDSKVINNLKRKTIATQCTGKTKSGSRCKRKTKNANGRCYQH